VDNHRICGTPDYYVQQLFSRHRGDVVLPVAVENPAASNLFVSAVRDIQSNEIILKVVNAGRLPASAVVLMKDLPPSSHKAQATILTSANAADENSLDQPRKVAPVTLSIGKVKSKFHYTFRPNSLTVLQIGSERD
jgi:alpha-N-arabinofuranosidase